MRLRFVSAPGGSAFMHELLSVVALEVEAVMDRSRIEAVEVSEGALVGDPGDVFVVVPHEFFRVLPAELQPDDHVLRRTIGFCVEHPGTDTFNTTMLEAVRLGACVAINDDATRQLAAAGLQVERFKLGYSAHWDAWGGADGKRPIDVLYMGTVDDRRSRFLAVDPETLADFDVVLMMPPHEPMTQSRQDFLMGADKLRLLSESKILLNLHRSESCSFEWVRAMEAMSNGAVVVSEHSSDYAPLVPGRHFISGSPHNLGHLARALLTDPGRAQAIREETYELLCRELTMRSAATMLAELACEVAKGPRPLKPARTAHAFTRWPRWPTGITNLPPMTTIHAPTEGPRPYQRALADHRATRAVGSVDAIVFETPSARMAATESATLTQLLQRVSDSSAQVLVAGATGESRNAALLESDAEFLLVLDSGDELLSGALEQLLAALDDESVDVAYGFVITPQSTFLSALPFEPTRLRTTDYLAPASLWRRARLIELGGWAEGIDGSTATSCEMWRHLANHDGRAALVQRPLVRAKLSHA